MGASTAVTHMILFIAVLGIVTGLVVGLKSFSDNAQSSMQSQSKSFRDIMDTSFNIEVVYHDISTDTTKIYVRNTGEKSHRLESVDVYINGVRIPRNEDNRTIEILEDTERFNKGEGIWDKNEKLFIRVFMQLDSDRKHEVVVTTPHEGREREEFST